MKIFYFFAVLLLLPATGTSQQSGSHHELQVYPPAEKEQVRYVWHPPRLAEEYNARVELIVGKEIETDGVNRYSMVGTIETIPIKGYGYDRYVVKSEGKFIRTLIGIPPGTPKVNRFIRIGQGPTLVRYNSRLPIVVYAPSGFIVRLRVWRPDQATIEGQPG